jgi:hypothetical protein
LQPPGRGGAGIEDARGSSGRIVLPPLPSPQGGLRLPPSAPFTWTFMMTYLVLMLVVPIVALLVRSARF